MKFLIILGDGMADRRIASLGNRTPLMAADIPNIDRLCRQGRCGIYKTVADDMPPGSEVANLTVLGYDPRKVLQGRGVLEAASLGIEFEATDLVMRCNLICVQDGRIKNHSAGHISNEEAHALIDHLNKNLNDDRDSFYPGFSFRNILILKNGSNDLKFVPPHDVPGTTFKEVMITPTSEEGKITADLLNELILRSQDLLSDHPINRKRISAGKDPANSVWFWSAGFKPQMRTLREKFGISGAVISAVDIIKGLGIMAGMDVIEVAGATGLTDTNYEGKAEAAIKALKDHDLVYLHIEAADEAGHAGDVELKIKALEYMDGRVVRYIIKEAGKFPENVRIAVLPDHATPCEVRTHTHDPVPFLIHDPEQPADIVMEYNEESCTEGDLGLIEGDGFIRLLLQK